MCRGEFKEFVEAFDFQPLNETQVRTVLESLDVKRPLVVIASHEVVFRGLVLPPPLQEVIRVPYVSLSTLFNSYVSKGE